MHQLCFSTKVQDCIGVAYTSNSINTGTISARSAGLCIRSCIIQPNCNHYTRNYLSQKLIIHATLFQQKSKIAWDLLIQQLNQYWNYLEVNYSSTLFQQKSKVPQELLIHQPNQYWNYLSKKSIIHQLSFTIIARLHRSHLYSNSINTGTIQARSQLFINFISAKVQGCIGVAYTATQSILELFKLEVDYSSTSFQQKCKIAQESLIQQLSQYWNYLSQKWIIHHLSFGKSPRLHKSHI